MMNVREYPSLHSKGRGVVSSLEVAVFVRADHRKTGGFVAGLDSIHIPFLSHTAPTLLDHLSVPKRRLTSIISCVMLIGAVPANHVLIFPGMQATRQIHCMCDEMDNFMACDKCIPCPRQQ